MNDHNPLRTGDREIEESRSVAGGSKKRYMGSCSTRTGSTVAVEAGHNRGIAVAGHGCMRDAGWNY